MRDGKDLEVSVRVLHHLGGAESLLAAAIDSDEFFADPEDPIDKQEDFVVQAPDVVFNIFDDTGFLLEDREISNYRWVTVRKGGDVPKRSPSFLAGVSARLSDLAGDPARVLIRIQDPV